MRPRLSVHARSGRKNTRRRCKTAVRDSASQRVRASTSPQSSRRHQREIQEPIRLVVGGLELRPECRSWCRAYDANATRSQPYSIRDRS